MYVRAIPEIASIRTRVGMGVCLAVYCRRELHQDGLELADRDSGFLSSPV